MQPTMYDMPRTTHTLHGGAHMHMHMHAHTRTRTHACTHAHARPPPPQVNAQSAGAYQERDSVGVDMAFARELLRLNVAQGVGLVPVAEGGTSLHDVDNGWRSPNGKYFLRMVHAIFRSLISARVQGHAVKFQGILWVQVWGGAGR